MNLSKIYPTRREYPSDGNPEPIKKTNQKQAFKNQNPHFASNQSPGGMIQIGEYLVAIYV